MAILSRGHRRWVAPIGPNVDPRVFFSNDFPGAVAVNRAMFYGGYIENATIALDHPHGCMPL